MQTMKAKFAGTCAACKAPIYIGEEIQWEKEVGAFCMHCDGDEWLVAREAEAAK